MRRGVRSAAGLSAAAMGPALLWLCRPTTVPASGPDGLLVCAAAWAAWLVAAYLGVAVAVATGASLTRASRRLGELLTGATVVSAVLVAGTQVTVADDGAGRRHGATVTRLDWPTGHRPHPFVTVRSGDCLWRIAARRLRSASPAAIAAEWPRWWQTNRAVIGADPGLIQPGQHLARPTRRSTA